MADDNEREYDLIVTVCTARPMQDVLPLLTELTRLASLDADVAVRRAEAVVWNDGDGGEPVVLTPADVDGVTDG